MFRNCDVRGKAVLVNTGWAKYWRTDKYFQGHPFLTEAAAVWLREHAAALVGIDSLNIDSTATGERPVHTARPVAGWSAAPAMGHRDRDPDRHRADVDTR